MASRRQAIDYPNQLPRAYGSDMERKRADSQGMREILYWKSSLYYTAVLQGLYNARHLRELLFLMERYPQDWEQKVS